MASTKGKLQTSKTHEVNEAIEVELLWFIFLETSYAVPIFSQERIL